MSDPVNEIRRLCGLDPLDEGAGTVDGLVKTVESSMTRYVRAMDNPMAALDDLSQELEEVVDGEPTMPALSRVEKAAKNFAVETNKLYGDFRKSRETVYEIAKAFGVSTRRRSPKKAEHSMGNNAAEVVASIDGIAKSIQSSLSGVANKSARYLKDLRAFTPKLAKAIEGDKDSPEFDIAKGLVIDNFIDDVRGPNSTYFEGMNAIAKRIRKAFSLAKHEFGIREADEGIIHLDSEDDEEFGS